MLNIRCNDVQEADHLYRQLKAKFNGDMIAKNGNAAEKMNGNTPMCECGRPMILRNGRKGSFYGCSGYPQCRRTRELNELAEMASMEGAQLEEIQIG